MVVLQKETKARLERFQQTIENYERSSEDARREAKDVRQALSALPTQEQLVRMNNEVVQSVLEAALPPVDGVYICPSNARIFQIQSKTAEELQQTKTNMEQCAKCFEDQNRKLVEVVEARTIMSFAFQSDVELFFSSESIEENRGLMRSET